MSGKTARRNRKNSNHSDIVIGFPPINDTTLVFTIGYSQRPKQALLRFGNTELAFSDDCGLVAYDTSAPSFAESFCLANDECVEALLYDTDDTPYPDVCLVGGGHLLVLSGDSFVEDTYDELPPDSLLVSGDHMLALREQDIVAFSDGFPTPTSLVLSDGFKSCRVDRSGQVSRYEHPWDGVLDLVIGKDGNATQVPPIEWCLCPQETTRLRIADVVCEFGEGFVISRNGD